MSSPTSSSIRDGEQRGGQSDELAQETSAPESRMTCIGAASGGAEEAAAASAAQSSQSTLQSAAVTMSIDDGESVQRCQKREVVQGSGELDSDERRSKAAKADADADAANAAALTAAAANGEANSTQPLAALPPAQRCFADGLAKISPSFSGVSCR